MESVSIKMKSTVFLTCLLLLAVTVFSGCAASDEARPVPPMEISAAVTETPRETTEPPSPASNGAEYHKEETMTIKVSDGTNEVLFRLNSGSAAKSLYEQLPLTTEVNNYGSNERIFYPPEKLDTSEVEEGSGPAGVLAYFSPWGNVVMYYGSFASYPGLYIMGEAIEGLESIENLSGTISITAE